MPTSRALVTGASGFLGRHLVRALQRMYDVVDGVDISAPDERCPGPGRTYLGDLRDVLPGLSRYDAVFHLAALVGGRGGIESGPLTVAGNLATDLAFFEYVARTRPAHAAYMSSSAVYPARPAARDAGRNGAFRYAEGSVQPLAAQFGRPDGTYGWVKLTGEHLAHLVRERFDVPVVCYRPFTVYGPEQSRDYPVAAIAARALAGEDPLTLWGSGRQVRDFVYIDDAVAAIATTHRQESAPELNVCTGVGTDFLTVARIAAACVGYQPTIRGDLSKPAGVDRRIGSPDRLNTWFRAATTVADGVGPLLESLARNGHR
ncbi:MAG TPA: NAD-dependent epimerase/dehydratase family protein [Mycobacteriales bacterium]|nr:NAD-dependent epimerase/dehydratase family protein [Mycobacteriales bacterium]